MRRLLVPAIILTLALCVGRILLDVAREAASAQGQPAATENGDTNGDGSRDIADAIYLLSWLFTGGPAPVAVAGAGDVETRLAAVEGELQALQEGRAVEDAIERLRSLTSSSEEVWNFPLRRLEESKGTAVLRFGTAAIGRVIGLRVSERMSAPNRIDAILELSAATLDPREVVGVAVSVEYQRDGRSAYFSGEVARCSLSGVTADGAFYHVTGYSRLHRLTRGRRSRVFQDMRASDIVSRVLAEAGLTGSFALEAPDARQEYVVQYNETDLDFISRLLEDEGISYFLVDGPAGSELRFGDGRTGRVPPAGTIVHAGYRPGAGAPGEETIAVFRRSSAAAVGSATVGEWDLLRAQPVFATATLVEREREEYEFGIGEVRPEDLAARAQSLLELLRADVDARSGESNAADLRPGHIASVEGVRPELSGSYLVTSVEHAFVAVEGARGSSLRYGNTFTCIPEALGFRPPRVTPKPRSPGLQTALVAGPAGGSTHTDELGRVKVRFPWDRSGVTDDTASAWIRVAQGSSLHVPEIGDEVLVGFEHGDIHRPIIIGRLWNGADPPPPR